MAGPITIRLKEALTDEQLFRAVSQSWDEKKYGKPQVMEVNSKQYLGFVGTDWISVLVYPKRKKVVVQSMPVNYQIAFSKEGKAQLKHVNREVLPVIAQALREVLADVVK